MATEGDDMTNLVNVHALVKGDRVQVTLPSGSDATMYVVAVYTDNSLAQGNARTALINLRPDASGYGITLRPDNVARYNARPVAS